MDHAQLVTGVADRQLESEPSWRFALQVLAPACQPRRPSAPSLFPAGGDEMGQGRVDVDERIWSLAP